MSSSSSNGANAASGLPSSSAGGAGTAAHPFKAIGVYTFKGGTSKTTTTIHLAGSLAANGHRVLVIDFDPQCNLTDYLKESSTWINIDMNEFAATISLMNIGNSAANAQPTGLSSSSSSSSSSADSEPKIIQDQITGVGSIKAAKLSNFIDAERQTNGTHTIYKVLAPIFEENNCNGMYDKIKEDDELLAEVNWLAPGMAEGGDPTPLHGNFYLLRGSTRLAEFGGAMNTALCVGFADRGHESKLGCLQTMMAELAHKYTLDFIVVDMSPSSGAMNEAMAMSCDYLLPPANADSFSAMSAHGMLTANLPRWFMRKTKIVTYQNRTLLPKNTNFKWKLTEKYPKILPFLVSRYELGPSGELSDQAQGWIISVEDFVNDFVSKKVPPFIPLSDDEPVDEDLSVAGEKVIESLQRQGNKMTMAVAPQNEEIHSFCSALGRTLPELSLALIKAEYHEIGIFDESTPGGKDKADTFERQVAELQKRFKSLAEWITFIARENDEHWKGGSGRRSTGTKRKRRPSGMPAMFRPLYNNGWRRHVKRHAPYHSPWLKAKKIVTYVSPRIDGHQFVYHKLEAAIAHYKHGREEAEKIEPPPAKKAKASHDS